MAFFGGIDGVFTYWLGSGGVAPARVRPRQPVVSGRPVEFAAELDTIFESRPEGGAIRVLRRQMEEEEAQERE